MNCAQSPAFFCSKFIKNIYYFDRNFSFWMSYSAKMFSFVSLRLSNLFISMIISILVTLSPPPPHWLSFFATDEFNLFHFGWDWRAEGVARKFEKYSVEDVTEFWKIPVEVLNFWFENFLGHLDKVLKIFSIIFFFRKYINFCFNVHW